MTVNAGSNNKEVFTPPVSEDLSGKEQEQPKETEKKSAAESTTKNTSFEQKSVTIGIKEMVDSKEKIATTIMKERIQHHMQYLNGKLKFKDDQAQIDEQVTFIETIGNSLKLDYPQFVIITNELLNQIKANKDTFTKGSPFRFMSVLNTRYSPDIIKTYQTYIIFLTRLANNWSIRYKLNELVDLSFVIKDMDRKAKENMTRFFNDMLAS